jgi:hypothetical protein
MTSEKETDGRSRKFGSWQDAEELRKWSFLRRSPQQRLDWLVEALTIAYECDALKPAATPIATSLKGGR